MSGEDEMKEFLDNAVRCALTLVLVAALGPLAAGAALAADGQPRDFMPAPPGTHLGLLYYLHGSSDTFVDARGDKVPGSELDTNIGIARYVYFFDVGDTRADINVVQPFGGLSNMSIGGQRLASDDFSLGDTSIVATFWPINDPERNRYFAVATWLTLPTGHYDANVSGLGTNRWSVSVQPAYYFNLAPRWSVDLVGDVTTYGDNDDGPGGIRIEKDPSFTVLGWLNYHASDATTVSFGLSSTRGGEERWGGVDRGDSRVTTPRMAWSQMLNPTTQLLLEMGTDVDAENTFERDFEAVLRLAKFF
nr:F268 [uncultured bacterium]ART40804.1 L384 [uncultured bacterium]